MIVQTINPTPDTLLVCCQHKNEPDYFELITMLNNPTTSKKPTYHYTKALADNTNLLDWFVFDGKSAPVPFIDLLEWNVSIKDKHDAALAAQLFTIADECGCTIPNPDFPNTNMNWRAWLIRYYHPHYESLIAARRARAECAYTPTNTNGK